jgi:hypothetical protein
VDETRQPGDDRRSDALKALAEGVRAEAADATEPLPQSLRQRLERCAEQWSAECAAQRRSGSRKSLLRVTMLPWFVATAAIALAVVGWWPQPAEFESVTAAAGGYEQWRAQRAREQMLATAGVGHWAWGDAAGLGSGDVVWDSRQQRGFLRLHGFVPNDPRRARYQLWIFDAARDDRYPVDGGVFDVPAGRGEVVVPVYPALPVSRPVAFAITVERPGGAVVSAREKIVAFAHAGT